MPIWNDHDAQLDFVAWLERHQQDGREQEIRDVAKRYAEGMETPHNRVAMPFAQQQHPTAYYTTSGPPPAMINFRYNDIILDIHPDIQGFQRQLLAEIAIREQLDLGEEPGD